MNVGVPSSDFNLNTSQGFLLGIKTEEEVLLKRAITNIGSLRDAYSKDKRKYYRSLERLEDFGSKLSNLYKQEIDPIEFLIYLYYEVKFNYEEMFDIAKSLGLNYAKASSLHAMLSNVLEWKFRGVENMTPEKRIAQCEKSEATRSASNAHVIEENLKTFRNALKSIVEPIQREDSEKDFSLNEYESISSSPNKVFYLLDCFGSYSLEDLYQIYKNTSLSPRSISRIVNEDIKNICRAQNISPIPELKQTSLGSRFLTFERREKSQQTSE